MMKNKFLPVGVIGCRRFANPYNDSAVGAISVPCDAICKS